MNLIRPGRLHDEEQHALATLRAYGYQIGDIQEIARDQQPFAVRTPSRRLAPAPGVRLVSEAVELGEGAFTNSHTLTADLEAVQVAAVSAEDGFYLRDRCTVGAVAAVSGSFAFISDDPSYQPAEPCLDFCCRAGAVVSLPTASKSAFLVHEGKMTIRQLSAEGTLRVGGRIFDWIGSKEPGARAAQRRGALAVFGAASCRIVYADHPRTGFVRFVRRAENITSRAPTVVDAVVARTAAGGHTITSVHPGGGADLFEGSWVLRASAAHAGSLRPGARVEVASIAGLPVSGLSSGVSLGPSLADAAAGRVEAYDESLGLSPFRDVRYGRTLVWTSGREISFRVYDGAPLTDSFRGVTPTETATLLRREGVEPAAAYHLDGGQSSKIAFQGGEGTAVLGNLHYLKWPREPETRFRWRGVEGRRLHSCFVLRTAQPPVTGRTPPR